MHTLLYRSRPNDKLEDDALRFLSSIDDDKSILYYDIVGSQAHSIMLHDMGHITSSELKKILSALEEAKKNPAKVQIEGYEDIHEALEAFVIKHAGMNAGGKMHTARSRNDQVVLDIRMKIRDDINEICAALSSLVQGLVERAKESKQVPMLMYTHLQQAQIGTFSHFLLSYAYGLMRDMERLYLAYHRINQSPLGACAIGGSSIAIDRKRTAMLLGFDSIIKNSIDATSSRDAFIEYASTLAILTSTLGRIAEDFIIWSTTEFGYIELAEPYTSTSSAMPQKKNPKIMDHVVRSLQINKERMRQAASTSYAIALDIAEQLVMQKNITFRTAHRIVGALVNKATSKGNISLVKLEFADATSVLKAHKVDVNPDELMKIINGMTPEKSLEARKSSGSPNLLEQEEMIKSLSQGISNYCVGIQKRTKMIEGSFDNLERTIKNYLEL
ncbi:MAG: argH [Nitrososphaera sp.]|nr:argH [Nitrososphaera sp.]